MNPSTVAIPPGRAAAQPAPSTGPDHGVGPHGFVARHVGPDPSAVERMLAAVGVSSLDKLVDRAVPAALRSHEPLALPAALSEPAVAAALADRASRNQPRISLIGLGYYGTHTPAVVRRGVLENPGWYTAYTPYQPEISQGRLEALLGFQTVVADLTGLPVAGASLLDEATAAAEAMSLARRVSRVDSPRFLVDVDTHPQTLAVLATRAEPVGIELVPVDPARELPQDLGFGLLLSYPASSGAVRDLSAVVERMHAAGGVVAVTTDLLALTLLTPPGEWGADIAVGSAQRFGVPMGFGGPHAGFMSVRAELARSLPGRLVGISVDADGAPAYRLALQTREQHIRREKATSNICTAQVLLAVVAAFYAEYHGPEGLTAIATAVHERTALLAAGICALGVPLAHEQFFDTLRMRLPGRATDVVQCALDRGLNLWRADDDTVAVSLDETTTDDVVDAVLGAVAEVSGGMPPTVAELRGAGVASRLPAGLRRTSPFLTHPSFHDHRSETAMLRRLRRLADRDIALDRAMIPLGSCTMKLNAATEMEPITDPRWASLHPFAPLDQAEGYRQLFRELEEYLAAVTGYDAVSLQPNAGSQGEFAGLLAIRAYHRGRGQAQRDVCLIPSSAHGTNAASAVLAGMRVVVVACTEAGEIDLADLDAKIAAHADRLAVAMLTYPSTFGVYEPTVTEVCARVHDAGGQVYVDGANLNALVGLARPGRFGADVSHLNLHKTFCIPHGGGGPGVGPIGVRAHLAPYLPGHPVHPEAGPPRPPDGGGVGPVSAAPWGSAGILTIPWAYVRLMGGEGLTYATKVAVLAANYIAARLRQHYPVLYTGNGGLVAHECIVDLRALTKQTGVTVDDVAKRLVDYGFHAPTMSFPVAGTLMIEPTESEDLAELDRFCDAMIAIREEIARVAAGEWQVADSPLRGAPHTAACLLGDWDRPYSRELAAYPVAGLRQDKYWPPVRRVDGAYGDRNLVCSCPDPAAYAT